MSETGSVASVAPSPRPLATLTSLPPKISQRIVDELHPHDALALGSTNRAFRQMSTQHPLLRAPLAWGDPALCVTPRIAARKLADMSQDDRQRYFETPYFATRPDEHQVHLYGTLYPYLTQPIERIAQSAQSALPERMALLDTIADDARERLQGAIDSRGRIVRKALFELSKEDQKRLLRAPPEVPRFTSTLARMASLFLHAGARPSVRLTIGEGLVAPIDDHLFGADHAGGGVCRLGSLLRDIHSGDAIDHILEVLTQRQFEREPRLVRRLWYRVGTDPWLVDKVLRTGLDPMTHAMDATDTLPDSLLGWESDWEDQWAHDHQTEPLRFWPPMHLMCWHVLQAHGFDLDSPLAGRSLKADTSHTESTSEAPITYRAMLEAFYGEYRVWLFLAPFDNSSLSIEQMLAQLNERMRSEQATQSFAK